MDSSFRLYFPIKWIPVVWFISHFVYKQVEEEENEAAELGDLFGWGDRVEEEEWRREHKKKKVDKNDIVVEHVYLVTASDDATIRIWKPTESDYLASLEKHNDKINSVALSKHGMLATASSDSSVNVWDMRELFQQVDSGKFVHRGRDG